MRFTEAIPSKWPKLTKKKRLQIFWCKYESASIKVHTFLQHALVRRKERLLVLPDILHVLKNGWHEKKKDIWNKQFGEWDYAIRGVTEDNHHVRVVVSFDEQLELLIITVIKLDKV